MWGERSAKTGLEKLCAFSVLKWVERYEKNFLRQAMVSDHKNFSWETGDYGQTAFY
jgi:hypothetical protein